MQLEPEVADACDQLKLHEMVNILCLRAPIYVAGRPLGVLIANGVERAHNLFQLLSRENAGGSIVRA